MAIFNSYVKLPEGSQQFLPKLCILHCISAFQCHVGDSSWTFVSEDAQLGKNPGNLSKSKIFSSGCGLSL